MVILCDTCSILMLIRISPDMFTDSIYETITIPSVLSECKQTQKFKNKYPWRDEYISKIIPQKSTDIFTDNYKLHYNLIEKLMNEGTLNDENNALFNLSRTDKEIAAYAIAMEYNLSTGDKPMMDFISQQFSEYNIKNFSSLDLINRWLRKEIIEWNIARQKIIEEWSLTEERSQPVEAIKLFETLTDQKYHGP